MESECTREKRMRALFRTNERTSLADDDQNVVKSSRELTKIDC